ncbi:MAG: isopentenyl-diphosphate Delta-isomerase [Corynebacterium sp.]|nr:isopentenyl-diphosphate Delta-isomerase [Corynebacterium sp.]
MTRELVVLAGPDGLPAGTMDKSEIHSAHTPLHFAFSAWVIRDGKVLVSRRALGKKTWPGVWTNSYCGHPGPGEEPRQAVVRRGAFELGLAESALESISEVLPDFSYRAVDSSGIVEHEICPVFVVRLAADARVYPNPEEVDSVQWVAVDNLIAGVEATGFAFSPWMVEELQHPELRSALSVQAAR